MVNRPARPAAVGASRPSSEGLTIKRIVDVLIALPLAVLLLPLAALVALALRLEVPGPVFCTRPRVGRGGATFELLRFRTAAPQAEGDGRWTPAHLPVARLVRRARLDGLLQIVNVLRGDMSVVGPRPEPPEAVRALAARFPGVEA